MAETKKRGFGDLINLTSDAFNASTAEKEQREEDQTPKMLSNRQSVYRVPLSMIKPDRFQARFLLPFELREAFFRQEIDWEETVRKWMALAEQDRLVRR